MEYTLDESDESYFRIYLDGRVIAVIPKSLREEANIMLEALNARRKTV